VATTPVGAAVRLIDWRHPSQAYIVAREWRRRLQGDGYGRALSDLEVQLRTASSHRDRVRLRRLVELAYAWEAAYPEAGLRADDFVQLVESERAESPAEDPVRIMTVHRSKGLEFDMVVLPQLYGTLHGRAEPGPLGYRPEEIGAVTHAFPYVSNDLMPLFKDIHELYAAQRQQRSHRLRDALGTLYVGMTRARHALHMIIPSDSDGRANRAVSPARILRETLSADAANAPLAEGVVVYESGEPDWMARVSRPLPVQSRIAPPTPPKIALRRDTRRTRGLERVTPSAPGDHETIDVERVLGIGRNERSFVTGTLVHAWLETLEWSEDGLAPEPKLRTIASQIVPEWSEDDVQSALLWLRDRIGAPEVDRALSRQSWPDGAQVEREIPFIVRERDTIVEGIMDRLVLILGPERKISEAVVLDYKTDRFSEEADGTSGRLEHYRGQIAAYRRAVQAQFGLVPERVSGKLVFLEDGSVIEVLET
jgi:ATP-dependent exoDNAse (exonuclease V) beta subunit